jgi:hypothetical protein
VPAGNELGFTDDVARTQLSNLDGLFTGQDRNSEAAVAHEVEIFAHRSLGHQYLVLLEFRAGDHPGNILQLRIINSGQQLDGSQFGNHLNHRNLAQLENFARAPEISPSFAGKG